MVRHFGFGVWQICMTLDEILTSGGARAVHPNIWCFNSPLLHSPPRMNTYLSNNKDKSHGTQSVKTSTLILNNSHKSCKNIQKTNKKILGKKGNLLGKFNFKTSQFFSQLSLPACSLLCILSLSLSLSPSLLPHPSS